MVGDLVNDDSELTDESDRSAAERLTPVLASARTVSFVDISAVRRAPFPELDSSAKVFEYSSANMSRLEPDEMTDEFDSVRTDDPDETADAFESIAHDDSSAIVTT
jgi:hypothetical protein